MPPGAFAGRPERPPRWDAGPRPLELAPWGRRAIAATLDGLIVLLIASAFLVPALVVGLSLSAGDDVADVAAVAITFLLGLAFAVLATIVYQPLMLWRTDGRTVGKRITGVRVVRADRLPMDLGTAMLREVVVKSIAVGVAAAITVGAAYLVDWFWPFVDDENRALHDFPVDTRVVIDDGS